MRFVLVIGLLLEIVTVRDLAHAPAGAIAVRSTAVAYPTKAKRKAVLERLRGDLPRAAGDERAAEPRRAELLRA